MGEKFKPIPTVPFEVIIKGHEAVNEGRKIFGPGDPTIALVRSMHKDHQPDEILAVSYRLGALAKFIQEGEGKPWTFAVKEDDGHMVNEALFRAAARAPLMETKTVGDVTFDHKVFMQIALEESESEGTA